MATNQPGLVRRTWQWIREHLLPPRPQSQPRQNQKPGGPPEPQDQQDGQRYDVQSDAGRPVSQSDSLAEAHRQWQDQTGSQGRIIDTWTGEDVTPPPDDDGRYVVFDEQGRQMASFDDKATAGEFWQDGTGGKGRIIDIQTGADVTPKRASYLTNQQLRDVLRAAGKGSRGRMLLPIDPKLVTGMLRQINKLAVPVFDISNIAGKGVKLPTRTVPIKRRKVEIVAVRKQVWVENPGPPHPSGMVEVPYPTEEMDLARLRRPGDITRAVRSQLAAPRELLQQRIARRELLRPAYQEEVAGEPTVVKRREWREFEEPKVTEWTEDVQVSEEPHAQLLEVVIDVSGSMYGSRIHLAVALALAVIGGHLNDDSRYIYRAFASYVGSPVRANTTAEKQALAKALMTQEHDLGGGTDILSAITIAAQDVRAIATKGDQPEVLLITDGDDSLSAEQVYRAIGDDVILHTVVVDNSNASLRARSSTYYELSYMSGIVRGNDW